MATLRKLRRREESVPFLLLVPFIDVLLVLICFVLSVSFDIQYSLQINLPEAETGKVTAEKTLNVTVLQNGTLVFQGKTISVEGFPVLLASALKNYPADSQPQVVLSGDEEIPYFRLIQVMDVLRTQGLTDISLLTRDAGSN